MEIVTLDSVAHRNQAAHLFAKKIAERVGIKAGRVFEVVQPEFIGNATTVTGLWTPGAGVIAACNMVPVGQIPGLENIPSGETLHIGGFTSVGLGYLPMRDWIQMITDMALRQGMKNLVVQICLDENPRLCSIVGSLGFHLIGEKRVPIGTKIFRVGIFQKNLFQPDRVFNT